MNCSTVLAHGKSWHFTAALPGLEKSWNFVNIMRDQKLHGFKTLKIHIHFLKFIILSLKSDGKVMEFGHEKIADTRCYAHLFSLHVSATTQDVVIVHVEPEHFLLRSPLYPNFI